MKRIIKCFFLFVLCLILITFWWKVRYHSYIGTYNDDSTYIILAKTLLSGKGYVNSMFPEASPHRQFPPGFSITLMPFVPFIGDQYEQLIWVNIILSTLVLFLCYILFRDKLPFPFLCVLLALISTNHLVIVYASSVMSEPLFMLFSLTFFLVLFCYEKKPVVKWQTGLLLGMLSAISISVRAIGILLLLPIFYCGIIRKDIKLLVSGTIPTIVLLVAALYYDWFVFYTTAHHGAPFSLNTSVFWINLQHYLKVLVKQITWQQMHSISNGIAIAAWGILIPIAYGFYRHWKEHNGSWGIYCVAFFIMIVFFRVQDNRLLLPILPFFYYFTVLGLVSLSRKIHLTAFAPTIIFILTLLTIHGVHWFLQNHVFKPTISNTPDLPSFKWLIQHTTKNDLLITDFSPRVYLFTGRKAIGCSPANERYQILLSLYLKNIKYLYFTTEAFGPEATGRDLVGTMDYWKTAHEDPSFRLVFEHHSSLRHSFIYELLSRKSSFLKAFELTNKAATLYQHGDQKKAAYLLRKALTLEPDFYLPMNLLGIILVDKGKIEEGLQLLKKSTALYPSLERCLVALAYAYTKTGRHLEAKASLRKALALAKTQHHDILAQEIQQELEKLQKGLKP